MHTHRPRPSVTDLAAEQSHAPDLETIQHRAVTRRRRRRAAVAGAFVAAVTAAAAVSQAIPHRDGAAPTHPVDRPSGSWTPIRATDEVAGDQGVLDPADATNVIIDIRRAELGEFGGPEDRKDFRIEVSNSYAGESVVGKGVAYGVVIDADGDLRPDCHLGISNSNDRAAQPQGLHVWLSNLDTGRADDRVGGPYGVPFDFSMGDGGPGSAVTFFFLNRAPWPCDDYGPGDHFYAYTSLTENGRVTGWDFAPDNAWIQIR